MQRDENEIFLHQLPNLPETSADSLIFRRLQLSRTPSRYGQPTCQRFGAVAVDLVTQNERAKRKMISDDDKKVKELGTALLDALNIDDFDEISVYSRNYRVVVQRLNFYQYPEDETTELNDCQ
jgi:hypothetical protein